MDKLDLTSPDLTARNIDAVAELFPGVVTETLDAEGSMRRGIDFDLLRQELSDHVVEGPQERYRLDWPGKRAALLAANAPIRKTLRPMREESVDFDTTKNIFIEGDNLEALKLLQESYLGKVKLIYIDPPYNTGNDFIYKDDFAETTAEYLARSGQTDDAGTRLVANTESNGRFHSDWLSMMYARLKLARNLLSADGSIFINIDFNEVSNLKKLMDEVFGAENFQRQIVWRIGWLSGYKTIAPNFIRNHDNILFYSRRRGENFFSKRYIDNSAFKPVLKATKELSEKLDGLGLGKAQQAELLQFVNHGNRPERYPIEDTWNSNEYDDLNSIAIVSFSGEKVSKMLAGAGDFKGQKSLKMLRRILEATTEADDLVLDFFAGTASTAHAVMQANGHDGGRRRHIMIQVPEPISSDLDAASSFRTIAHLARERLRVAGRQLESSTPAHSQTDIGFRTLRVENSNTVDALHTSGETTQDQLSLIADIIQSGRTDEDLLFQVLLDWGLELSVPLSRETVDHRELFVVDDGAIIACFAENVSSTVVREIAERQPLRAVFRDSGFATDAERINAEQIFRQVSPATDVKTI